MKSSAKLYQFHTQNLRAVSAGLADVLASARSAIVRRRTHSVQTHLRLYAFLLGAWAECRLHKLLYEPNTFNDAERETVFALNALPRWHAVLEVSFRRHYGIPKAPLRPPALLVTAAERLRTLRAVLDDDLASVITLRNKLAHGQWVYPLNDRLDDVAQPQMKLLQQDNLLTLKFKGALVESLCSCIHDVVVSKQAFERDFDKHLQHVEQLRIDLVRRPYKTWEQQLIARYERGRADLKRKVRSGG